MELIDKHFNQLCAKYTSDGDPSPGGDVPVNFDLIDDWAWRCGISIHGLLDEFAVRLARKFDLGEFTFELCDAVANDLYGICLNKRLFEFPPLFWEVFGAFDAGEFHRKSDRSDDPVGEHTIPMIKEILAKVEATRV